MYNRRVSLAILRGGSKKRFSSVIPASRGVRSGRYGNPNAPQTSMVSPTSQAWKPFDRIVNDIMGQRFSDEFNGCNIMALENDLPLDCKESGDNFELQFDLPGLKKDDIHVVVKDRVLTISGEKKGMVRDGDESFRRIERFRGHMERSLSLPEEVDEGSIQAKYVDGVLHLWMLKLPQEKMPTPKTIDIM